MAPKIDAGSRGPLPPELTCDCSTVLVYAVYHGNSCVEKIQDEEIRVLAAVLDQRR
jgi:hypothetical protein